MSYSLQESQGRYTVTVKSALVNSKGWEKGQGLDRKLVKNKLKFSDGSDTKLQYQNGRFFVSVPIAEELGWSKGDELDWSVDGNGALVLQKQ